MGDRRRDHKPERTAPQRAEDLFYGVSDERSLLIRGGRTVDAAKSLGKALLALALVVGLLVPVTKDTVCRQFRWIPWGLCDGSAPINDYLTNDPKIAPQKSSTEDALVGIEPGMRLSDVEEMFPASVRPKSESGYSSQSPPTTRIDTWTWRGIAFVVTFDLASQGAIDVTLRRGAGPGAAYASLPRDLLLGRAKIVDAITAYDRQATNYEVYAPEFNFVILHLAYGPQPHDGLGNFVSVSADLPAPGTPDYEQAVDGKLPLHHSDPTCFQVIDVFTSPVEDEDEDEDEEDYQGEPLGSCLLFDNN